MILPGAGLLEVPDQPALPAAGFATFSAFPTPAGPSPAGRIIDRGVAVVTNRRVVLYGNRRREWSYAKLTGLAHLPDNRTTLMRVANRVKVSGLSLDPAAAAGLRFNLALALADFAGDRRGFVAHLERQTADHHNRRPRPPLPATPDQAPFTARFGPAAIAAATVAAVLLLCGVGAALAFPSDSDQSNTAADSTTPVRAPTHSPTQPRAQSPSQAPTSAAPHPRRPHRRGHRHGLRRRSQPPSAPSGHPPRKRSASAVRRRTRTATTTAGAGHASVTRNPISAPTSTASATSTTARAT